jgi:hypothetical protein
MKKLSDKQLNSIWLALQDYALDSYGAEIMTILRENNAEIEELLKRGDLVEVWDDSDEHEIGVFFETQVGAAFPFRIAAIKNGEMIESTAWKHARKLDLAKLLEDES